MRRSVHSGRALLVLTLALVALVAIACGRRTIITADADRADSGPPLEPCGRGRKPCDPDDLAGKTCESLGLGGGELRCDPATCNLDITDCTAIEDENPSVGSGAAGRAA